MSDELKATGGVCAPIPRGDWWGELHGVGLIGSWPRPSFGPLRGWRTWFRRGDAGGPLLGHVTPFVRRSPRVKDLLPVFRAERGPIRFVRPPS